MSLANKNVLIFGVVNKRSLAFSIALKYQQEGANVSIVCQNEKIKSKVNKLADQHSMTLFTADVTNQDHLLNIYDKIGILDVLVHSVAFAPLTALESRISEVEEDDFLTTINVSAYSLIKLIKVFKAKLSPTASILTMSYLGSSRVMTGYGVMGIAKATLESTVRYLADDLGPEGMRVNAISAGPVKTMASSTFNNFNSILDIVEQKSPMRKNITGEDVANLAYFLGSDQARLITGGIHFVDGGSNTLGA